MQADYVYTDKLPALRNRAVFIKDQLVRTVSGFESEKRVVNGFQVASQSTKSRSLQRLDKLDISSSQNKLNALN